RDLQVREKELQELTKQLEQKVEERTAALKAEIAERKQLETQLYQAQKMEAIGRVNRSKEETKQADPVP
ncbi:MAG: hypothetical protein HY313_09105, partial [Acidobacteria bacterium]|nr:hypothetical protein [Acidobacteriota bacterium]